MLEQYQDTIAVCTQYPTIRCREHLSRARAEITSRTITVLVIKVAPKPARDIFDADAGRDSMVEN